MFRSGQGVRARATGATLLRGDARRCSGYGCSVTSDAIGGPAPNGAVNVVAYSRSPAHSTVVGPASLATVLMRLPVSVEIRPPNSSAT